jgi:hypothetical protein
MEVFGGTDVTGQRVRLLREGRPAGNPDNDGSERESAQTLLDEFHPGTE